MWEISRFSFLSLIHALNSQEWFSVALRFFPFVLLLELPLYLIALFGMARYGLREFSRRRPPAPTPSLSCIVLCYAEGEDVTKAIETLVTQYYPGFIEIIAVIDGAVKNRHTLGAARRECERWRKTPMRRLIVLPKWQRGGRVSSLNAALNIVTGEIVMALDGDTSFDNDMAAKAVRHFADARVVGVAGNLRVRNQGQSLVAKMQGLEYLLSISGGKTGFSEFNIVNNISGAFGIFRTSFIRHIGGWDAGSAEDLDITMRIKQYFGRHRDLRIVFEPHAIGHTDVPTTWHAFFRQRVRWDGDLFYLFIRKFRFNLRPALLGWRNFFFVVVSGLMTQLLLPFMIVVSSLWMFLVLPIGSALGVLGFVYGCYFTSLLVYYVIYLIAVSERVRFDLSYLPYLPLFPLFGFINRVHNTYSILCEILLHSHLDSSMAPVWVLRKNKF
ncbi:MAG: glycosyltransferase [Zoogloeaceae bacterium]|jgi:cellulose synthase/poly-beta-1,6-N-acetylglucosamine synthase-like glycosyltransferase|nr:glycosyltransferase [Zoogloeaceae bacterium]